MQNVVDDQFVQLLTAAQLRMFAYIVTLISDTDAAGDVLQETNVEVWSNRTEFRSGSNFGAWARKIAHYKALSYLRDRKRDLHVYDDELLALIASQAETQITELDQISRWLDECLSELPASRRKEILDRYRPGNSVSTLARAQGKSAGAVSKTLARTRARLLACLQHKATEDHA